PCSELTAVYRPAPVFNGFCFGVRWRVVWLGGVPSRAIRRLAGNGDLQNSECGVRNRGRRAPKSGGRCDRGGAVRHPAGKAALEAGIPTAYPHEVSTSMGTGP